MSNVNVSSYTRKTLYIKFNFYKQYVSIIKTIHGKKIDKCKLYSKKNDFTM